MTNEQVIGRLRGGEVVRLVGIEPTTIRLKVGCSTTELQARAWRRVLLRCYPGAIGRVRPPEFYRGFDDSDSKPLDEKSGEMVGLQWCPSPILRSARNLRPSSFQGTAWRESNSSSPTRSPSCLLRAAARRCTSCAYVRESWPADGTAGVAGEIASPRVAALRRQAQPAMLTAASPRTPRFTHRRVPDV
jgi:hypothetical protein